MFQDKNLFIELDTYSFIEENDSKTGFGLKLGPVEFLFKGELVVCNKIEEFKQYDYQKIAKDII